MKQTIRFKGLTLNRDEQSAAPGEMSLCGNVEIHDGALRASVLEGTEIGTISDPVIFVHTTASYKHFISKGTSVLKYSKESGGTMSTSDISGSGTIIKSTASITSISAVGNTLVVMVYDSSTTNNVSGLHYFLCSESGGNWSYSYLGTQPPFLKLQFNLRHNAADLNRFEEQYVQFYLGEEVGISKAYEEVYESMDRWSYGKFVFNEKYRSLITDAVFAEVNKRIDEGYSENMFYAPFFVRYCYRLFDGAMFMHSAPVMMIPMLYNPVMVAALNPELSVDDESWYFKFNFKVFMIRSYLQAKLLDTDPTFYTELNKWKDIVKSVDIFITPQYSRIKTSGVIEGHQPVFDGSFEEVAIADGNMIDVETLYGENCICLDHSATPPVGVPAPACILPQYFEGEHIGHLRNASSFFKITSVPIEDINNLFINGAFHDVPIDDGILKNITTQEQMKDDYKTHNLLLPISAETGGSYVYNHRLNVYGIAEKLFEGFMPELLFPYVSGESLQPVEVEGLVEEETEEETVEGEGSEEEPGEGEGSGEEEDDTDVNEKVSVSAVHYWIKTEAGTRHVHANAGQDCKLLKWLVEKGFCFYPDSRAVCIYFESDDGDVCRKMDDHQELNGAYSFLPKTSYGGYGPNSQTNNNDPVVLIPNKVYTSRADNPYYFPNLPDESGINTVGVGEIAGLGVATRALSQGQVGDHDVYIFCSDGIWVFKISSTGTYTQGHNISREVCTRASFICQLDQSVLFATNRGLVRIVESDVVFLTDVLDGPYFDIAAKMSELYNYYGAAPTQQAPNANYDAEIKALMDFKVKPDKIYYNNGSVIYDFTGSRLIVLPEPEAITSAFVALIYSIRDGAWSTMYVPALKSALNSYPNPYVQDGNGKVICLDKPYDFNPASDSTANPPVVPAVHNGLIVTRTLTFSDTRDVLRGFRQYCDCQDMPMLFFYGSNDQISWTYIGQTERSFYNYMPGRPYRFFRIAMHLSMTTGEKYQELTLEIINKYAKL